MKLYLARDGNGKFYLHVQKSPPGEGSAKNNFWWTCPLDGWAVGFPQGVFLDIKLERGQFAELVAGDVYETDLVKRERKP